MGGDHHNSSGAAARSALFWALVLNGSFLVVEASVGFLTGSLALLMWARSPLPWARHTWHDVPRRRIGAMDSRAPRSWAPS